MTPSQLRSLIRVHELDRSLLELQRRRKAHKQQVADKARAVERNEAELAQLKAEIQRLTLAIRDAEQKADEAKQKIGELRKKRDSASSARMLSAVDADISASSEAQEEAETSALEQMEALDAHHAKAAELEARLEKLRAENEQAQQELTEALTTLEHETQTSLDEREAEFATLDEAVREQYERLRASYPSDALVTFDEAGYCEGCSTKLPPDALRRVRAMKEVVSCPNCGRLLYNPVSTAASEGES